MISIQYDVGLDVLVERTFHRATPTRGHRYKISPLGVTLKHFVAFLVLD